MPLPELNTDYDPRLLEKAMGAMNLKRSLLQNAVLEQQQKYLSDPDIMKMERGKTEQEFETGKINLENLRKLGPSVLSKSWIDQVFELGPTVTKQGYTNFYNSMMKTANDFGITPPVQLPTPVEINTMYKTDEAFNKFKTESLTSLKQQIDKMTAERKGEATRKVQNYIDSKGNIVPIDVNNPEERAQITRYGLKPYEKPAAPSEASLAERAAKGDEEAAKALILLQGGKGEKSGQNWILPNRSTVISYDGGKTYVTSDGRSKAMPVNAVKVPGGATLEEIRMNEAKQEARTELEEGQADAGRAPKQAALSGTGPYKRVASAFEAVAGGLGLDILVGQQGFFPDMADAKQYLRSVKQMGKAALMNSSRGAIWEQQRIDELFPDPDKTFTNPRIEARKFGNLRDILTSEKTYNNQAIMQAISPKEVEKYRTSNNEIDRLVALISEPSIGGITAQEKSLVDKYLKRGK